MKKTALTLSLLSIFMTAATVKAAGDGLEKGLSKKEMAEILPWAKDVKKTLEEALREVSEMEDYKEGEKKLIGAITDALSQSGKSYSKLMVRFSLNRGLKFYNMVAKIPNNQLYFRPRTPIMILKLTVVNALYNIESDMAYLSQKETQINYLKQAQSMAITGVILGQNVITPKVRYAMVRAAMEYAQYDLYQDGKRTQYAREIEKMQRLLKRYPAKIGDYFKRYEATEAMIKQLSEVKEKLNNSLITPAYGTDSE